MLLMHTDNTLGVTSWVVCIMVCDTTCSLQEIEIGVKQIVKVCFMNLMYYIDLVGEHIKSCNMQLFYFVLMVKNMQLWYKKLYYKHLIIFYILFCFRIFYYMIENKFEINHYKKKVFLA